MSEQSEETDEGKTFTVGDLVKLKSDGPIMTVEKVRGDSITCVWFDGKKAQDRKFAAATLERQSDRLGDILIRLKGEDEKATSDVAS